MFLHVFPPSVRTRRATNQPTDRPAVTTAHRAAHTAANAATQSPANRSDSVIYALNSLFFRSHLPSLYFPAQNNPQANPLPAHRVSPLNSLQSSPRGSPRTSPPPNRMGKRATTPHRRTATRSAATLRMQHLPPWACAITTTAPVSCTPPTPVPAINCTITCTAVTPAPVSR